MKFSTPLLSLALYISVTLALPVPNGPDADDKVRNSWSATTIANRGADADEQVRNSWSAGSIANRAADADEQVRNSWSAGNVAN